MIDDPDDDISKLGDSMADEIAAVASVPARDWPATLAELVDVLTAVLVRRGMKEEPAEEQARHLVAAIAKHHGGRPVYLPTGARLERALMHAAIYRASRRGNSAELARKYGITMRAVQRIVREQTIMRRRGRASAPP